MSRVSNVDVIEVKPTMNVYTALVAAAVLAELIAFIALYLKSTEVFADTAKSLFS
jgi:hypothetical protein